MSNTLSPDFITHWQDMVISRGGNTSQAHRDLVRAWQSGKAIPGYPADPQRGQTPTGWSQANLNRYAPRQAWIRPSCF